MEHTLADALIVTALAALLGAYLYFRHAERIRRLEIVHQERLAAMEKGIPLPELPLDPPKVRTPPDPREPLLHGIVWITLGAGGMVVLGLLWPRAGEAVWSLPLPLVFLGAGLILYYALASRHAR